MWFTRKSHDNSVFVYRNVPVFHISHLFLLEKKNFVSIFICFSNINNCVNYGSDEKKIFNKGYRYYYETYFIPDNGWGSKRREYFFNGSFSECKHRHAVKSNIFARNFSLFLLTMTFSFINLTIWKLQLWSHIFCPK